MWHTSVCHPAEQLGYEGVGGHANWGAAHTIRCPLKLIYTMATQTARVNKEGFRKMLMIVSTGDSLKVGLLLL